MFEVALHGGIDHPSLVWVLLASIVSFVAGIAIGTYADGFERIGIGARE